MDNDLPYYNVINSEIELIQQRVGIRSYKDLLVLFHEQWGRENNSIPIDYAEKVLKINIKRLKKDTESHQKYISFDKKTIISPFISKFFEQNMSKKISRKKWNETRNNMKKQQHNSKLQDIISKEKWTHEFSHGIPNK